MCPPGSPATRPEPCACVPATDSLARASKLPQRLQQLLPFGSLSPLRSGVMLLVLYILGCLGLSNKINVSVLHNSDSFDLAVVVC